MHRWNVVTRFARCRSVVFRAIHVAGRADFSAPLHEAVYGSMASVARHVGCRPVVLVLHTRPMARQTRYLWLMVPLMTALAAEVACAHGRCTMALGTVQVGVTMDRMGEIAGRQHNGRFRSTAGTRVARGTVHRLDLRVMTRVAT